MNRRIPTHPGEIIKDEIDARGMSVNAFAVALGVPASRLDRITKGERAVSPDTAIRLATLLGGSPEVWIRLQAAYDLAITEKQSGKAIRKSVDIKRLVEA